MHDLNAWVYVGGTFDLFHQGHINLLRAAGEASGAWVVASVNTDEFAARYKRKPIMSLEERMAVVDACVFVDDTVINVGHEESSLTIDGVIATGRNVKYIAHGDDWHSESLMRQMGVEPAWLASRGIELLYLPYTKGVSTSEVIRRCKAA